MGQKKISDTLDDISCIHVTLAIVLKLTASIRMDCSRLWLVLCMYVYRVSKLAYSWLRNCLFLCILLQAITYTLKVAFNNLACDT